MPQLNDTYEMPWFEHNIPASTENYQSRHSQEYLLQDLTPDTEYVTKMRARNVFGASEITEEFLFRTAAGFYFHVTTLAGPDKCHMCAGCMVYTLINATEIRKVHQNCSLKNLFNDWAPSLLWCCWLGDRKDIRCSDSKRLWINRPVSTKT